MGGCSVGSKEARDGFVGNFELVLSQHDRAERGGGGEADHAEADFILAWRIRRYCRKVDQGDCAENNACFIAKLKVMKQDPCFD